MTSIGNYMALKQKTLASSIPARVSVFEVVWAGPDASGEPRSNNLNRILYLQYLF